MSGQTHGGKGDRPRVIEDRSQYESNWDKIFGNKEDYLHHDYEDTSTPREVFATSVYITEYGSPKAMSQEEVSSDPVEPINTTENFARKMREWNMMYDCLQNIHLYEYPIEEVKELLKRIKV